MPEAVTNTRAMFDDIFNEIAEEESAAAAEADTKEDVVEEENTESDAVEEESEEEESYTEETEEVKEEEEEETEEVEEEESKEEEEESEETEEKDVDKEEKVEYTENSDKRKITVDGEDIEVDADTAFDNYQRKVASDRRFKEASTMKKESETFWESVLANPGETLVDRIVDEFCSGDRVQARAVVIQNLLEWMAPEREASAIEDEKEKDLFRREHEMKIRQQEADRREQVRVTRQEREADDEFDTNIRRELLAGFEEFDLPEKELPIWKRATDLLKEYQIELPANMQDDIVAIRAELVKNARRLVGQVAKEREQAIKDLVPTLSQDELAKHYPDLVKALKRERVGKAKKKRSAKSKGNIAKKQEEKQKKLEKITHPEHQMMSTDELFKDM